MFRIVAQSSVKKDIKNLDRAVQKRIKEEISPEIEENPYKSYELQYEFKGLRSYHFSHQGVDYRIVYEIYETQKIILIVMIGKREKFYEVLKRRYKT